MSLWGDMLSFLWSKYLWVEWLGYMVSVCLTFQETTKLDRSQSKIVPSFSNIPSFRLFVAIALPPFHPLAAIDLFSPTVFRFQNVVLME